MLLCLVIVYTCLVFSSSAQTQTCSPSDNRLQFLFMASNGSNFNTFSSAVGMQIALDRIRMNTTIFENYTFNYSSIEDSQCARTKSLSRFIHHINGHCPRFISVLGCGCSVATEPVAEMGSYWGLSHISFASSAINLRLRERFQNYFQLYPSEDNYVPGIAAIFQYFGWTQVAIITQKENLFTETQITLTNILMNSSITVLPSLQYGTKENPALLSGIFPENARIFFVNSYENKARQVVCKAYNDGLYGSDRYVWVFYGWYSDRWWELSSASDPVSCTSDQLYRVIENSLAVQQYPINEMKDKKVIGNISYNEFQTIYNARLDGQPSTYVAHIAYDATWTLALALNRVIKRIASGIRISGCMGTPKPLGNWSYYQTTAACYIRRELEETNFEGLTGQIQFDSEGIRLNAPVRIFQTRNSSLKRVATWINGGEFTYIGQEDNSTLFTGGEVPSDGKPIRKISTPHIGLISVLYVFSFLGIVFCVVCLIFTVCFKNKKLIRLTSPNLNFIIIFGTGLVFFSIFFRSAPVDTSDEERYKAFREGFCNLTLFLDFIGYTLAFGTILAKMWRIYYIFHNPSPNKKIITDIHLIGIIIFIAIVTIVLLGIGYAIPQTRPTLTLVVDKENVNKFNDKGIPINYYLYRCFADSSIAWLSFVYIYLGLLQIIALILAIQTRKVRIKILNDSKEVAAIIYITSIIIVELVIVSFALSSFNNVHEVLFSGGLFVAAFVILIIIFVPKMIRLWRDPEGENIDKTQTFTAIEVGKSGALTVVSDKQRISILESQVMELKSRLGENDENTTDSQNGRKYSCNLNNSVTFTEGSIDQSINNSVIDTEQRQSCDLTTSSVEKSTSTQL